MHWEEILDQERAAELEGDPGYLSTGVVWTETQTITGLRFHKCWRDPHGVWAHGCIPPEPR